MIDFNRAEPTCYRTIFHTPVPASTKWSFLVHSTTRYAPYTHASHDLILALWRTFLNDVVSCNTGSSIYLWFVVCLFVLMLYVPINTFFSHVGMFS